MIQILKIIKKIEERKIGMLMIQEKITEKIEGGN